MIKLSTFSPVLSSRRRVLFADWATAAPLSLSHQAYSRADQMAPVEEQTEQGYETPAQFKRQVVAYTGSEAPGTIIIDTPNTFLYLVQPGGRAIRYGIGVGRDGFRWSGVQHDHQEGRVAGLDAARRNDRPPALPAALHGRWPDQPARRARHVSRQHDLSHPRHQRPVDHRPARVVGLHPPHQRGRDRPRQPRERRHQGDRDQSATSSADAPADLRAGQPAAAVENSRAIARASHEKWFAQGDHAGPGLPGRRFIFVMRELVPGIQF